MLFGCCCFFAGKYVCVLMLLSRLAVELLLLHMASLCNVLGLDDYDARYQKVNEKLKKKEREQRENSKPHILCFALFCVVFFVFSFCFHLNFYSFIFPFFYISVDHHIFVRQCTATKRYQELK